MQNNKTPNTAKKLFKRWLLVALLCSATAPAMAAPPVLPAIVAPAEANHDHHVGKVIFEELVTPDLESSKRFYGRLFGWTFTDTSNDTLEYAEAFHDGQPVAGLIHRALATGEQKQPAWLTFMSTYDIDAEKNLALQNGAKLLFGPQNIPDRGKEAIFADPQGAVFAVLDSSSGDPVDALPASGEWIWSSLMTRDPGAGADFYQTLFKYDIYDLPSDRDAQHMLLASENYARASVNTLPAGNAHSHPHWLNYVRVEDTAKMTKRVVALGGHVLVAPRVDRHGGKIAIVSDPQGAPFGLIEWSEMDDKELTQ